MEFWELTSTPGRPAGTPDAILAESFPIAMQAAMFKKVVSHDFYLSLNGGKHRDR